MREERRKKVTKAGTKQNLNDIILAIENLKTLEEFGTKANESSRKMLRRFTGFGAVATKAFPDPRTGKYAEGWEELGEKLRSVLTDEEYESARATTFNAFYTSPVVMNAMWQALEKMGVQVGWTGLEPGCGIGGFMGAAPNGMQFIGVEQDAISGRIAKAIYPHFDIRIEDFGDTNLPEDAVDFAVGNVPFAELKKTYNGHRYSLHDYFFLKSLDAVRPGGVMALVTSRYTLDKADPSVRRLLAEKADFVGAMRLPQTAFTDQGTRVVTDIVFLRRKPREAHLPSPGWAGDSWITASEVELEGGAITINDYFQKHPHMVLGEMSVGQGMHNNRSLRVRSDGDLAAALHAALDGLPADVFTPRSEPLTVAPLPITEAGLPAHVQEGSFFIANDQSVWQMERGRPVLRVSTENRTKSGKRLAALVGLRDLAREVLRVQKEDEPEEARDGARARLRQAYDAFVAAYGPINKTTMSKRKDGGITRRMPNLLRFTGDPDRYLVQALEHYDERDGTARPAEIMLRDVVAATPPPTSVDSAKDGLVASLNIKGRVDIPYIASLYGSSEEAVIEELGGLIFFDPVEDAYVTADEYLSGNVRRKLRMAESSDDPRTAGNAEALRQVQPEDLVAGEIDVTLGTPWIPPRDVEQFLAETLSVSRRSVTVEYVAKEALWKVRVTSGRRSAASTSQYGTEDIDAFTLAEQALNMRTPTVRRKIPGASGESDRFVIDEEATMEAREKQSELKARFASWAFEEPEREARLVRFYNEHFNNLRLREFDGSHLTFPRMSSAIAMRPHQKDAIWRTMASGNTLLAHVVGAGKTFTMVSSGMEMKRTGMVNKPLYVVPNHMLEQFGREFLTLYPDANILVAAKEDLRKDRRQLLKSRMATGAWDGIIMTHSSFEKIAMSPSFQAEFIAEQIGDYEDLLLTVEDKSLKRSVTKRLELLKAARKERLKDMAARERKDGGLVFDELGIDHIFVDEAHMFKNLETPTKMDRVAGVQTGGSQRAFDLYSKVRYLSGKTPGRGVTFATGTPVSNSLGELYTMMRYLMPEYLEERGIGHFDAWAAAFGEVVNALEISPDGQGLRINSRFAKFKNLPELLSMFRLTADVQTAGMLKLPTPAIEGGKPEIVVAPMNDDQMAIQRTLVDRYEQVRNGKVKPWDDNALAIITDGRKLALDARLLDPDADDLPDSKINQLVDKVYAIWERTGEERGTQMIFSDLGVSETEWGFCVYDEIMDKLMARGVPAEEIAAIGDYGTDQKKAALFANMRNGNVRILLGSTAKMGTGTNVQARLCALHHVDPPWRPADIEQREGRILRQGNRYDEVGIYRYVTEGSFDAFMWQTLETKAKFIAQAMAGDAGTRRADDIGGAELSFAEVKAIASGSPAMLVLAEMELEMRQLTVLRNAHLRDQARIRAQVQHLPHRIAVLQSDIDTLQEDIGKRVDTRGDGFTMQVRRRTIAKKKGEKRTARQRADDALALEVAKAHQAMKGTPLPWERTLGTLGGHAIVVVATVDPLTKAGKLSVTLQGAGSYAIVNIQNPKQCPPLAQKLEQALKSLDGKLARAEGEHRTLNEELARYQEREGTPFASEDRHQALAPLHTKLKALLTSARNPAEAPALEAQIAEVLSAYRALETGDAVVESHSLADVSTSTVTTTVKDEVPQDKPQEDAVIGGEAPASTEAGQTGSVAAPEIAGDPVGDASITREPAEESQGQAASHRQDQEVRQEADDREETPTPVAVEAGVADSVAPEEAVAPETSPAPGAAKQTPTDKPVDSGKRASAPRHHLAIVLEKGRTVLARRVDGDQGIWEVEILSDSDPAGKRMPDGWRYDAFVDDHLLTGPRLVEIARHLPAEEREQLIVRQREVLNALEEPGAPKAAAGERKQRRSRKTGAKTPKRTETSRHGEALSALDAASVAEANAVPAPLGLVDDGSSKCLLACKVEEDRWRIYSPPGPGSENVPVIEYWQNNAWVEAHLVSDQIINDHAWDREEAEILVRQQQEARAATRTLAARDVAGKAQNRTLDKPVVARTSGDPVTEDPSDGPAIGSLAVVERDGLRLLAEKVRENRWSVQTLGTSGDGHREPYGYRSDRWVEENAGYLPVLINFERYLTTEEQERLIPDQRHLLEADRMQRRAVERRVEAEPTHHPDESELPIDALELAARREVGDAGPGTLALVQQEAGTDRFALAVKEASGVWELQSLHSREETAHQEQKRETLGRRNDAWVEAHLARNYVLLGLSNSLTHAEEGQLLAGQRRTVERDRDNFGGQRTEPEAKGVERDQARPDIAAPEPLSASENAPERAHEAASVDHGRQGRKGQLGLFATPTPPRETPSTRVERISRSPVQLGLFDVASEPTSPRRIVADRERPAALELRSSTDSGENWRNGLLDEDMALMEAESRAHLQETGIDPDPDPGEVARWQASLTEGEAADVQDFLDHGQVTDQPGEDQVTGHFTRMVGDGGGRLEAIIHDAIEHYEPYGNMVARLEQEAGERVMTPEQERGIRSLYNATLAKRSGAMDGRW